MTNALALPLFYARLAESLVHLASTSVVAVLVRAAFFGAQLVIVAIWIRGLLS